MKCALAFTCLAGLACIADALAVLDIGRKTLRSSARERVEIMALQMYTLEQLSSLPKAEKIPQDQQDHLVQTITEQISKVEASMGKIEDNDRQDGELEHQNILLGKKGEIGKATATHLQEMRDFRKKLNERSHVGALDFVSKMKNCIHFIKKGALNGDESSEKGLNDSLTRMGQMLGQAPDLVPPTKEAPKKESPAAKVVAQPKAAAAKTEVVVAKKAALMEQDPCAGCTEGLVQAMQSCAMKHGNPCAETNAAGLVSSGPGTKKDIGCCMKKEKHDRCLKCSAMDCAHGTCKVNKKYNNERTMKK